MTSIRNNSSLFLVRTLVLCILLIGTSYGETPIFGNIAGRTFNPSEGPYIIENDIEIPSGQKCIIPAGVIFLFKRQTIFHIHGDLIIEGANNNKVVFTSYKDPQFSQVKNVDPTEIYWIGLQISNSAQEILLKDLTIKYARLPIESMASSIILENVIFSDNMSSQALFSYMGNDQIVTPDQVYNFPIPETPPEDRAYSLLEASKPATSEVSSSPKPNIAPEPLQETPWYKKKGFRSNLLTSSIIGVGIGGYCFISANTHAKKRDKQEKVYRAPDGRYTNDHQRKAYDSYNKERKTTENLLIAGSVSLGVGFLFAVGFYLTFPF